MNGWVIGGSHPKLKQPKVQLDPKSSVMVKQLDIQASLLATISRAEIVPATEFKDFLEVESLGVEPPKRCQRCKMCKFCSDEGITLLCQEEEELKLIREGITIKDGKTVIKYPFIKDPNILNDNRFSMIKRSESLEKSLKRRNLREDYNEEFKKFLSRGVISEVSKEEIKQYTGPKNYISHHGVLQPWKITTPLRIVSNSSQENNGSSLNQCIPKGPNCLCDLHKLLLRFRTYEVGLIYDLSKAYHTVRTGTVEKFLRLMIWRFSEEEEWKTFAYEVMAFGDRLAATALECSKQEVADQGKMIDEVAAVRIREEMYVDDGASGGTLEEVQRFVGEKDEKG